MTPQMFTYQLLDRARSDRKRIVLPEGDDDRILKAAGRLLQRCVADLTILGDEPGPGPCGRTRRRPVGSHRARSADQRLCDQFAEQYAELRKHKGVTVEQAREIIHDVSYFGTMLVHNDMVDGMVSGARAHHRAHRQAGIRDHQDPARGVDGVEHLPDVSGRRGARLRRLCDRARSDGRATRRHRDLVGAYRRQFGIEPRVAMLSYSTGTSGPVPTSTRSGPQPNWCATRTRPAGRGTHPVRRRGRTVGGGHQDARLEVAGRATVLIFPDLNTGNNTYKAVQRSAGAIAIGPVLQGLNKPVNDLSRGALVEDIVNTVAITAIQAQGA